MSTWVRVLLVVVLAPIAIPCLVLYFLCKMA